MTCLRGAVSLIAAIWVCKTLAAPTPEQTSHIAPFSNASDSFDGLPDVPNTTFTSEDSHIGMSEEEIINHIQDLFFNATRQNISHAYNSSADSNDTDSWLYDNDLDTVEADQNGIASNTTLRTSYNYHPGHVTGKLPKWHYEKYHSCLQVANIDPTYPHDCQWVPPHYSTALLANPFKIWFPADFFIDECRWGRNVLHEIRKCLWGWSNHWKAYHERRCSYRGPNKNSCVLGTTVIFQMPLGQKTCTKHAVWTATGFDVRDCKKVPWVQDQWMDPRSD